jgi:hypothetical protein
MVAMAGRFWRPSRGWWHKPAGWALGVALVFPGALLAVPVSQYAQAWALPAEVTGIAIALAATVGFFVIKRHSWLLAAPLSFGLSFSLALALIEGWNSQLNVVLFVVQVALVLGAIGLTVAGFVISGRGLRRLKRASRDITREIGENIAHEGLFRDDGERIIVYASRGRVVLRVLTSDAALVLVVAGGLWVRTVVPSVFWQLVIAVCLGLLLCFGGVSTLLLLIRTLMTGPTLVVNADGILDNCSMIVTGRGLLRWNETLGVEAYSYSPNAATRYHFLDITVTDPLAINRRQPLWKRMLALVASQRQSMGFRISRPLLDRPPTALDTEINRYINSHAPAGSWHKAVTDDDEAERRPDEA